MGLLMQAGRQGKTMLLDGFLHHRMQAAPKLKERSNFDQFTWSVSTGMQGNAREPTKPTQDQRACQVKRTVWRLNIRFRPQKTGSIYFLPNTTQGYIDRRAQYSKGSARVLPGT